jgi:hypothetical protein
MFNANIGRKINNQEAFRVIYTQRRTQTKENVNVPTSQKHLSI